MKKVVGLLALAAIASPAVAQNFQLDLSLTARAVSGAVGAEEVTDIQTGGSINAVAGTTYRVELRYRIADLTADTTGSRGLSAANIIFSRSGTGTGSTSASFLTNDQASVAAISNPDASGIIPTGGDLSLDSTGLIGEFRGGVVLNTDPANAGGGALGNSWGIVPLALSAPNHNSWRNSGTANPSAANTNAGTLVWAIFSFDFLYMGGQVDFVASALADAGTGNRFGYFRRTGTANDPIPQTSNLATDGTISFVPAPGAAALLGLGGLIAARRRRA
jgi:hypothetical protein